MIEITRRVSSNFGYAYVTEKYNCSGHIDGAALVLDKGGAPIVLKEDVVFVIDHKCSHGAGNRRCECTVLLDRRNDRADHLKKTVSGFVSEFRRSR